ARHNDRRRPGGDLVVGGPQRSAGHAGEGKPATYAATGLITREALPMLAIVVPAMLVPTLLGARLYHGISDARFRQIVLGMLTLSGVAMLVASVPKVLARWV
ncbi:hypothetical protein ACQKEU_12355, partial [Acidovorax sp. NPDC077664]